MALQIRKITLYLLAGIVFFFCLGMPVHGEEPVIVVLDPGHGGENLGAEYGPYTEKYMTMIVAEAMKEELEKYEGITVHLTREDDKDMTLEERVMFAKSVNADFLFCLHFNMSVKHDLFGAEVWVSAFDDKYQRGYTFASVEMDMLKELGLYSRGIKTKLNDRGEDYYGILRHATANDLAAVLIEHCHLDQENDKEFYTSSERLKQFGVLDATAVAKYYGLKSKVLGVDYSNYQNIEIPVPASAVKPDNTEPDICMIDLKDVDTNTGNIGIELSAQDYDSYMLYYSYSYDGGLTFSDLQRWLPQGADTINFTMNVPSGTVPEIVVRAYNGFDGFTESNHIYLPSIVYGVIEEADSIEASNMAGSGADIETGVSAADEADSRKSDLPGNVPEKEREITVAYFLQVSLICAAILLVLFILAMLLLSPRSKKKRRRRK